MRRWLRVILIILALIVLALGVLYLTQRENINAAVVAVTSSEEEIREKREQAKESLKQELESATGLDLDEIEAEVREEAVGAHPGSGEGGSGGSSDSGESGTSGGSGPSGGASPVQELTAAAENNVSFRSLLKQFYQLQGSFSGQLASLPAQAEAEFRALPEEEWTEANKFSIIRKYVGVAGSLERQCDGQVMALVGRLRTVLQEQDMDPSIADRVLDYYVEEKGLQKASYINRYGSYLS